jgi:cell division protein FtsA
MNNKKFEVYFDCGTSKIRAGAFNKIKPKSFFCVESKFLSNHAILDSEIQQIVSNLEEKTKEYLDDVNLMIDSPEMLSIGISISKKLDESKLNKDDIKFLIQDAKQQVLRNHSKQVVTHIIIKNYKIDNIDYSFLPEEINCKLISLDILFICLPKLIVEYFKKQFFKLNISINQIFCSSYVKSINYKDNLSSIENILFIDMGFNKTSITCFSTNEIIFLNVLPIGGNHITKDISKVLRVDLQKAEEFKKLFDKNESLLNEQNFSSELLQQIMFARVEEILELSIKSIKLNLGLKTVNHYKMVLMGEGSRILDNRFKEKITFSNDIDLLEETTENIFQSALKINRGANKQEVVTIPKKQIKQGFFEKLFHFFK